MFYTLAGKLDTKDQELIIDNLNASRDHWHSIANIKLLVDPFEMILFGKPDFASVENKLIQTFLSICKQNPRIDECIFYTDNNKLNSLICLCISNVATFKPENFLKRNISIAFKKQAKSILISDITHEEWQKVGTELTLPGDWLRNEVLTTKYNKYKRLFI